MKVLMTADAVGGVWTYALELCAALVRRDVQVVLAVMGPGPSDSQRAQAKRIERLRVECADLRLEWMQDPWDDVARAGEWLLGLAQREAADLIHLNGYVHAALPWRKPVVVVAHSCVCSWWQAVHGAAPPAEWDTYKKRVAVGIAAADHVVAPTRAFLEELKRWREVKASSSVIHNARSAESFACDPEADRQPMVFSCGRLWDEAKNMRVLDEAARALPWPTYVAGDVSAPDGRRFSAESMHCLGPLSHDDLSAYLKRAAIYVHAAGYEPFGLSVLEAALAGCALVLADLPGLRELWDRAALFAPPGDARALHETSQQLIENPKLRKEISRESVLRARQFTPEIMGNEYLSLYTALCARGRTQERAVA